ncbi:MAG: flagellar biosynthetic protein FliO [Desulfovibrio sp.]|nr:flagellar biosynthetic protein FliO [Desulfovibrio sp.]
MAQAITAAPSAANPALEQTIVEASTQIQQGVDIALQGQSQAVAPVFTWSGYIQALGVLFVLVALFCLCLWLVRRFGHFRFLPRPGSLPRDALLLEAQLPLGPRKGLMVVRFLNKRLLLGITEQRITLLSEEQAKDDPDSAHFEDVLEDARSGPGR